MGHLMCAACFTHLLADGRFVVWNDIAHDERFFFFNKIFFLLRCRLRDQVPTCPNCRVEISKSTASRNLAVEKAVSELPSECQFCNKEFPSKSLERHEKHECEERPTNCKFKRIGCPWKGPIHEGNTTLTVFTALPMLYLGLCVNFEFKIFFSYWTWGQLFASEEIWRWCNACITSQWC